MRAEPPVLAVRRPATVLAVHESGQGVPVLLLHGLTATHRYVVMGSNALARCGHRAISYDARGHGASAPARDRAYDYGALAGDLEAVLDACGLERAVLAGASMGAQTAVRFALDHPERVAALVAITPAFDPAGTIGDEELTGWDRLADGLREGGVEGFLAAYDLDRVRADLRATVAKVLRQRLGAHEHPEAVADALEAVPRSRPFESRSQLEAIAAPTVVVASRDEADPGHPLAVADAYAAAIPGARLVVEDAGPPPRSPIAWQGARLSRLIAEVAAEADTR